MNKILIQTIKTLSFVSILGLNLTFGVSYAQNIIPNNDGVGTQVNLNGNTFEINGGTVSGQNLFHSFQQFGLDNGQIANFLAQPNILNILSRINGGNPSVINGIINSNANLFLMNPAGIIFGKNATVNINGDFSATTATGIGFENGFFNNIGTVDYANLIGNPVSYRFDNTGGIILNNAEIELATGNLLLTGNTIINEGKLTTNNGDIIITAVPDTGLLRVSFPNSLITWEIAAPADGVLNAQNLLNAIRGNSDLGITVNTNNQIVSNKITDVNITPENGTNTITGEINSTNNDLQILGKNIEVFGNINAKLGSITLRDFDTNQNERNINITGNLDTPLINTQGSNFNLNKTGDYTFNSNLFTLGADVNIKSQGDLIINKNLQTFGGNISLEGVNLAINNANLATNSGDINLTATNNLLGKDIDTQGGNITINGGNVTLENLVTSDDLGEITNSSGNVNINANNISLSSVDTRTTINSSSEINAGNINLIAENNIDIQGATSDNIAISSAVSSGGLGNAGNINIESTNGRINFTENDTAISATTPTNNLNNSGTISLNAVKGEINFPESITIRNFTNSGNSALLEIKANSVNGNNLSLISSEGFDLGNLNLTGNLDILLNDSATITNSGVVKVLGKLTFEDLSGNNSNLLLNNPNNDLNIITVIGNQQTTLNDVNNIILDGINSDTLTVTANNLNQTGKITATQATLTTTNDINLTNSANEISNLTANGNQITINNSQDLSLNGIESDTLTVTANNLNQTDKITATQATLTTTNDINLTNSANEISNLTANGNQITVKNSQDLSLNGIESDTLTVTANNLNQTGKITANQANLTANGDINLTNSSNEITSLNAKGQAITVNNSQDLSLNGIESDTLTVTANNLNQTGKITSTQTNLTANGNIILENNQNQIDNYTLTAGKNVTLTTTNNINLNQIITNGGEIKVNGNNITSQNSLISNGGNIELTATENIKTQAIISSNSTGNNAKINLTGENITTGNLESSGESGGNITIKAETTITTGAINSSGSNGNGGNVNLDTTGNLQVMSINADSVVNGQSGTIDIKTDNFFRATGTFINSNNQEASISSVGNQSGGSISIQHGGEGKTPFIVGDSSINGTTGIIATEKTELENTSLLFTTKKENIAIISVESPPEINPETNQTSPVSNETSASTLVSITEEDNNAEVTEDKNNTNDGQTLTNTKPVEIKTIEQAKDVLTNIQSKTGAKPALIYVSFTPKNISLTNDFAQRETDLTHKFEQHLNDSQSRQIPAISVTEKDTDILEIIIVAGGQNIRYVVEEATRDKVLQLNSILRKEVTSPGSGEKRLLVASKQLYEWLIKPIETDLNRLEINNLVFVMDTGLRSLPLAALHDGNGYIIEKYSVGLMPSLSLVDTKYVPLKNLKVLGMGADTFTNQNPLPSVPTELNIITSQLWQGQSFLNQDFTVDNLIKSRKTNPVGILHLATHGEFNSGKPENSYIQFENRRLALSELGQLRLNDPAVELLVLSACKTALGDNDAELGFAGLAHQAGVKTALGSLWYVSDEGTLGLMSNFYQQLLTAPIKAEALREAQLAMLHGEVRLENGKLISGDRTFDLPPSLVKLGNKELKHPYFWSAFTMIGNPW